MKKNFRIIVSSMLVGAMAFTSVSSSLPVSALNIGAVEVAASESSPSLDLTDCGSTTLQESTGTIVSTDGETVYVDATIGKLRWNASNNWQVNKGTKLYLPIAESSKVGLKLYNYGSPSFTVGDKTASETITDTSGFLYTAKAYEGNTLSEYGYPDADASDTTKYICVTSNADYYLYTTFDIVPSDDVATGEEGGEEETPVADADYITDSSFFMCEKGYSADDIIIDNEYATVKAGQNFTVKAIGSDLTVSGRSYVNKANTSSVNTSIGGTNYRVIYVVTAKKDCKVIADAQTGKEHALILKADNTKLDTTTETATLAGDIKAGDVLYYCAQGTNDGFLGIAVTEPSQAVDVSTKITLDGEAISDAQKVTVKGFRQNNAAFTTSADGTLAFAGVSTYDYTITAVKDNVTYQGVLSVAEDTTYPASLDLSVVAAKATVVLQDGSGAAVSGAEVVLSTNDGLTPVTLTATTDATGTATFESLDFVGYYISVPGYDIPKIQDSSFAPSKTALSKSITVAESDLPTQPADASNDDGKLYVGYKAIDGYTNKIYYTVQSAVDAAEDGAVVVIAPGYYHEQVTLNKSVSLVGNPEGVEDGAKPVIWYNENQGSTGARGFHGDTLMITATAAEIVLDNIRIENNSEADLKATGNATALSSCVNNSKNVITVNNCQIYATRDTIYTGKSNCSDKWTFTNTDIYGFQDVVCGGGSTIDIIDCNWILNYDSDARLLVPQSNANAEPTVMTAKNLTIKNAELGEFVGKEEPVFTKAAYLGRPWGNGSYSASTTQAIVDGYTDLTGRVPETKYFGYDTTEASPTPDKLDAADWLVKIDNEKGLDLYGTTNASKVIEIDEEKQDVSDDGAIIVVGKVDDAYFADIDAVGFAVFDSEGALKGIVSDSVVYEIEGSEGVFYSVSFVDTSSNFTVKPYYEKDGYALVTADSIKVSAS